MCVYIANNLTSASVFVFGEMKLNSLCQSRERLGPSLVGGCGNGLLALSHSETKAPGPECVRCSVGATICATRNLN